ncbi:MAG: flavodoxin family protein [Chloroflexi bacterium]|nr:flavodoxin family protein [Chloroflexota bacterium]
MIKKILMISGSPRKNGDGAKILKKLESILTESAEIECEYLFLKDYKIETCRGCLICQKKTGEKCPIKDDISIIKEKFHEADGFVFISPVYIRMISAQMKQLFDRLSFLLHRPIHYGKPALLLCTASYAGLGESLKYLKIPVSNIGMHIVDSLGVLSTAYKNKDEYKDKIHKHISNAAKIYIDILFSIEKPKPSPWELFLFNKWRYKAIYHRKEYPGDYECWEDQELLDKDYYYPTRINPILKRLIPFIVKKLILRLSKKIGYLS